jgi:hypothetical protein
LLILPPLQCEVHNTTILRCAVSSSWPYCRGTVMFPPVCIASICYESFRVSSIVSPVGKHSSVSSTPRKDSVHIHIPIQSG